MSLDYPLILGSDELESGSRLLYLIGEPAPQHIRFLYWAERTIPRIEVRKLGTSQEASLILSQTSIPETKRIVIYSLGVPDEESLTKFSATVKHIIDPFKHKLIICETLFHDWRSVPNITAEELLNSLFAPPCTIAYPKNIMSEGYIPAFIYKLAFAVLSGTRIGQTDAAELLEGNPPSWSVLFSQLRIPLSAESFHADEP